MEFRLILEEIGKKSILNMIWIFKAFKKYSLNNRLNNKNKETLKMVYKVKINPILKYLK